jgi:hypothetical protein
MRGKWQDRVGVAPGEGAKKKRRRRAKKSKLDVAIRLGLQRVTHLAELTAKFVLQSTATTRRGAGEVEHVLILPAQWTVAIEMLAAGVKYADNKKTGNAKWPGAPHQHVWAAMIRALLEDRSLAEADRQLLQQHSDQMDTPQKLVGHVNTCIARKTKDAEKVKVSLHVVGLPQVEVAVVRLLADRGGEVHHSAAPRNGLEKEIDNILRRTGAYER